MTSDNKLFINLSAKLDTSSEATKLIKDNIKDLEKKISHIKIKAELDTTILDKQIKKAIDKVKKSFKDISVNVNANGGKKSNSLNSSNPQDMNVNIPQINTDDLQEAKYQLELIRKLTGATSDNIHLIKQYQDDNLVGLKANVSYYEKNNKQIQEQYNWNMQNKDFEKTQVSEKESEAEIEKNLLNLKIKNVNILDQIQSLEGQRASYIKEMDDAIAQSTLGERERRNIVQNITDKYKNQAKEQEQAQALSKKAADLEAKVRNNIESSNLSTKKKLELEEKINKIKGSKDINDQINGFRSLNTEINVTAKNTKSLGYLFKTAVTKFNVWMVVTDMFYKSVRAFKAMYTTIINLDTALTELKKVTNATNKELSNITSRAYKAATQLGRTGQEVIEASSEWARAGYTLEESFNLAKTTLLFTNIADGIDSVTEASSSLISVMSAFNLDDTDALKIVDLINQVSNTQPINGSNITTILKNIGSAASAANNSLEQTVALSTAAFKTIRDSGKTSTGLNYLFTHLQGLDEDGNAIDGLTAKYQKLLDTYTKGQVKIMRNDGSMRSTYDILDDLHNSWDSMTQSQQNYIAQQIAGTRQYKTLIALMQNWDTASASLDSALMSNNSALEENKKYLDSVQGRLSKLKSTFQEIAQETITSDGIKWVLGIANGLLEITKNAGGLLPVVSGLLGAITILNTTNISKRLVNIVGNIGGVKGAIIGLINNFKEGIVILESGSIATTKLTMERTADVAAIENQNLAYMQENNLKEMVNATTGETITLEEQEKITTEANTLAQKSAAAASATLATAVSTVVTAIGAFVAIGAIVYQVIHTIEQKEEERINATIDAAKSIQDEAESMNELYRAFIKYQGIINKTSDDEKDYSNSKLEICTRLKDQIKSLNGLIVNTQKYKDTVNALSNEEVSAAYRTEQSNIYTQLSKSIDDYEKKLGKVSGYDYANEFHFNDLGIFQWQGNTSYGNNIKDKYKDAYDSIKDYIYTDNDKGGWLVNGDNLLEQYDNMIKAKEILDKKFQETNDKSYTTENAAWVNINKILEKSKQEYQDTLDAISSMEMADFARQDNFKIPETQQQLDDMLEGITSKLTESGKYSEDVVGKIVNNISGRWGDFAKELNNTNDLTSEELKALQESVSNTVSSIGSLNNAWKEMCENGKLSADTVLKLIDLGYASALSYDSETKSIKLNKDAVKDLVKAKLEEAKADAKAKLWEASNGLKEQAKLTKDYTNDVDGLNSAIEDYVKNCENKDDPLVQRWISAKGVLDVTQELAETSDENIFGAYTGAEKIASDVNNLSSAAKNAASQVNTLASAWKEQQENGELSYSTILDLIDAGYASALEVDNETGAITLNKDAMMALIEAKLVNQKIDIETKKQEAYEQIKKEAEAAGIATDKYIELARAKVAANAADMVDTSTSSTTTKTTKTEAEEMRNFHNTRPIYMSDEDWEKVWQDEYKKYKEQTKTTETVEVDVETVVNYDKMSAYEETMQSIIDKIHSGTLITGSNSQGEAGLSNTGASGNEVGNKKTLEELAAESASAWKDAYSQLYKANRMTIDEYYNALETTMSQDFYNAVRGMSDSEMTEILKSTDENLKGTQELIKSWLDLSNELEDVKLNKITQQYSDVKKEIDKCSDAINNLGEIDTNDDKAKEAAELSKQYDLVCDALKKVVQEQENSNLSDEVRNELQKEYNELTQQRVSIEDKLKQATKDLVEKEKENKLLEIETKYKKQLLDVGKKIYGNEGKDEYTHKANERIDAIQSEIDALQAKKEAQEKINEQIEYENKLTQLQIDLVDAMNNKTTKVLTKQKDGTWQYEYSADQDKVKEIQDNIKDTQKEYNNWQFDQQIDALQKQIDNEQSILDTMDKQYEDVKYHLDRLEEIEKASVESDYSDIDKMVADRLADVVAGTADIGEKLQQITDELNKANELNNQLNILDKNSDLYGLIGKLNEEDKSNAEDTMKEYKDIQDANLQPIQSSINSIVDSANSILDKMGDANSFSNIDISKLNGVDVLSNSDAFKQLSDFITQQGISGLGATINISKVEFPNCTSDIKDIQNAIIGLPAIALQESKK